MQTDASRRIAIQKDVDILGLCETLLNENDNAPLFKGYEWHGLNGRKHARGVGFYVRHTLKPQRHPDYTLLDNERMLTMRIGKTTYIEAYAPVACASKSEREEFFHDLSQALTLNILDSQEIVLMGDFNAHIDGWASDKTNDNGRLLLHTIGAANLDPLKMNQFTYIGKSCKHSCLDYFISTQHTRANSSTPKLITDPPTGSDHIPIMISIMQTQPLVTDHSKRLNIKLLQLPEWRLTYQKKIQENLHYLNPEADAEELCISNYFLNLS